MTCSRLLLCAGLAVIGPAYSGDGISGPHTFAVDFSQPFDRYQMRAADFAWVASLVKGVNYEKAVVHFVRTSLSLKRDGHYPRFGFVPAGPLGIRAPFEVPSVAFMALELRPGALRDVRGEVRYPPEFAEVEG